MDIDKIKNLLIIYFLSLLDNLLLFKINIQENYYFNLAYKYLYPPLPDHYHILETYLIYKKDEHRDVYDKVIELVFNNDGIRWRDILNKDEHEEILLEIKYCAMGKKYRVVYGFEGDMTEIIQYPPHSIDDIREYKDKDCFKNGIVFAEYCYPKDKEITHDITEIIQEYLGPMNDFYKESGLEIKVDWFKKSQSIEKDCIITIMDKNGIDKELNNFLNI